MSLYNIRKPSMRVPPKLRKLKAVGCICNHISDFNGRTCPFCNGEKTYAKK